MLLGRPQTRLPREGHQGRVECQWQQEMASSYSSHGQNCDKVIDLPIMRNKVRSGHDDQAHNGQ